MTDETNKTTTTGDYPKEVALIPLREMVVFPKLVMPLGAGREKSVAAITAAMAEERHLIVLAAQKDAEIDDVHPEQIHSTGTIAEIVRLLRIPDGSAQIIVQGLQRVRITGYSPETRTPSEAFTLSSAPPAPPPWRGSAFVGLRGPRYFSRSGGIP